MENILIPKALLDSREFRRLTPASQVFLIKIYALHADVERFTIDVRDPQLFGFTPGVRIGNRLIPLVRSGLLIVDSQQQFTICNVRRVFRFRYSPLGELQEAA